MKILKQVAVLALILSISLSFNVLAMIDKNGNVVRDTPLNQDSTKTNLRWTWINDEACVNFEVSADVTRSTLDSYFSLGLLPRWAEDGLNGMGTIKHRDTYAGKWNQAEDGTWSFIFDDFTIPVGLTKIDDVIYAFNGRGELKEGYKYWNDYATSADGVATCQEQEYLTWLETQYIPACTSHE